MGSYFQSAVVSRIKQVRNKPKVEIVCGRVDRNLIRGFAFTESTEAPKVDCFYNSGILPKPPALLNNGVQLQVK